MASIYITDNKSKIKIDKIKFETNSVDFYIKLKKGIGKKIMDNIFMDTIVIDGEHEFILGNTITLLEDKFMIIRYVSENLNKIRQIKLKLIC